MTQSRTRRGGRNKKRRLTHEDYEELMYSGCHHGADGGGGRISPETFMLAHLMSKVNKNTKQQRAVVDYMNANQMRHDEACRKSSSNSWSKTETS